jgi:hypothetical protein
MNLRKEVVHRLLLAKSLLSPARNAPLSQANAHLIARQLLNAHDAADLVFAAVADHESKLPASGNAPSMLKCLELIGQPGKEHADYFKRLNVARENLKHVGNLPNTDQWATVGADVFQKLDSICQTTLAVSLEDLDELELLKSDEVKGHLSAAKQHEASQEFKAALEEVGKALRIALDEQPDLWEMKVGRAKAEDALKLTAFGISANDFLKLQEFLPSVSKFLSDPFQILWKQSEFGHPGNWRDDVADFCINTCSEVALGSQTASEAPLAVEFHYLYEYSVTAKQDQVQVWEDVIEGHLDDMNTDWSRPFREHKRYLRLGESVRVSSFSQPLVSEDLSLDGEWIKRVRISKDGFASLIPPVRAEFVDLAQVEITCVPRNIGLLMERFPNLPEIPWHEDPNP